ncbi:hypothetical protein D9M71_264450 [compost metagenome]
MGQLLGHVGQQHGVGTEFLGQQAGALQGAVGDHDALHPLLMQVAGDQGDSFTGADQQCLAAVQVGEDLPGQADSGKCHGNRVLADGGVGTHRLGGTEGGLEQATEQRADGTGLTRHGVGGLHLAKDLRLAEDHGIQPGCDAHHVTDGCIVLIHVGTGTQFFQAQVVIAGQPGEHFIGAGVVLLQIQLAAIAGGENGRLAAGRDTAQLLQGLHQLLRSEGHTFADVHRSGLVVDTKSNEGHAGSLTETGGRAIVLLHPNNDNHCR